MSTPSASTSSKKKNNNNNKCSDNKKRHREGHLKVEQEQELAAIWGKDVDLKTGARAPFRRGKNKSINRNEEDEDVVVDSDDEMKAGHIDDNGAQPGGSQSNRYDKKKNTKKEIGKGAKGDAKTKQNAKKLECRLHCFITPGTQKNNVREVFETCGIDPIKVELRTSQKGNALNKTNYAVLTFAYKAHAYWAAMKLNGTNQSDLIGVNSMKLGMMVPRDLRKKLGATSKKMMAPVKKKQSFII